MNLRQLRIFVEVCKHKSFTAASKALYMTQPAISHVIHDLENEIGTALFERTPNHINFRGLIADGKSKASSLSF